MNKENFQIRMNRLYKEAQAEGVAGRIGFAHKCQITKSQLNGYLDGNLTEICEVLLSIYNAQKNLTILKYSSNQDKMSGAVADDSIYCKK